MYEDLDHEWFLNICKSYSKKRCLSTQYSAIIVNPITRHVIAEGYNGTPKNTPHCSDIGVCLKSTFGFKSGTGRYNCPVVHAEANAIIKAGDRANNCVMYLWGCRNDIEIEPIPCFECTKLIINVGIKHIITRTYMVDPYRLYYDYLNKLGSLS